MTLGARLVQQAGFEAVYCGGYVSGSSRAVSEPLLSLTEQIGIAADAANSVDIPMVVGGGAGFGEPCTQCARCASASTMASPASTSKISCIPTRALSHLS